MSSSSSIISTLTFVSQQLAIYVFITILIAGVLGGIFNIMVFSSLHTFRQSPCAFYFTVMSFVNIGQFFATTLSRILITGFNIDWTLTSLFYCKFRIYFLQLCTLTSYSCMCLATIDQFLATCYRPYWQQWSNIKLAHRLCFMTILVWILHGIPFSVFYNQVISPITGQITCTNTNTNFQYYVAYGYSIIFLDVLPLFITALFGLLAYRNVQQIAHRTLPLVRRELDKQLTRMVLTQLVFNICTITPYAVISVIMSNKSLIQDPVGLAELQLATIVCYIFYYLYFASPFYIYVCVSKRFRQQFIYVIFDIHLRRWQHPRVIAANQVLPQS